MSWTRPKRKKGKKRKRTKESSARDPRHSIPQFYSLTKQERQVDSIVVYCRQLGSQVTTNNKHEDFLKGNLPYYIDSSFVPRSLWIQEDPRGVPRSSCRHVTSQPWIPLVQLDPPSSPRDPLEVLVSSTSYLATLLWVACILVLEYTLPSQAYPTNSQPSYKLYKLQVVEWLVQIYQKYLVQHQYIVIGKLLDLKVFGQKTQSYNMA